MPYFSALDDALEAAANNVLSQHAIETEGQDCFAFLTTTKDRAALGGYCTATPRRLAKICAGAMVGEMAFYAGQPRTVSIIAAVDSRVYTLDNAALKRMRLQAPDMAMRFDDVVIAKLSHALHRANRLAATLG